MSNNNLQNAKKTKNDEFYTQYEYIQKEINAYLEYNPDTFRNKTVLLPCDDPEWSNFTRFFAQNFEILGLKKLISTSYAIDSKKKKYNLMNEENHQFTLFELTDFELNSPKFDEEKTNSKGKIFILDKDNNLSGNIDINDLEWNYLEGDGDFRSDEVKKLRDEADIIVTNPPFSLFKEFIEWVNPNKKGCLMIGNMNAITYKETFAYIANNDLWLGATGFVSDMVFEVPIGTEIPKAYKEKAEKLGYKGNYTRLGNSCWFTNLDHGRRHQPLQLMTMEDNIKYSKHKDIRNYGYEKYDNFDAIEVSYTDAIPSNYSGVMGVPITFLDKLNPEQFEILDTTERWSLMRKKKYSTDEYKNANDLNATWVINRENNIIKGYKRLLIRYTNEWKTKHFSLF